MNIFAQIGLAAYSGDVKEDFVLFIKDSREEDDE